MESVKNGMKKKEANIFKFLMFRYFPYWPLFLVLIIICLAVAYVYVKKSPSSYEITSSILIKDESKGMYESKLTTDFDAYRYSKLVENELEVLHSNTLLDQVVKNLNLYAPVYEDGMLWAYSAYNTSPINIVVKDIDTYEPPELKKDEGKIFFNYDANKQQVRVKKDSYPLNQWVKIPYGTVMFVKNNKQLDAPEKPLFFYIESVNEASAALSEDIIVDQVTRFSSVVNLTYYDTDRKRGVDILKELITLYTRQSQGEKTKLAGNTVTFIEDRLKNVEGDLAAVEQTIQRYKTNKGIVNLSEQGSLYLNKVSENDQKIANINMQLAVLDQVQKYVSSKEEHAGIVPSTFGLDDGMLVKLLDRLSEAEMQYESLKKTTPANHPTLVSVTNQISAIRPQVIENINNQRRSLQTSKQDLAATNAVSSSILRTIPEKERQLVEINRQQMIKNDVYTYLLQKREEAALSYSNQDLDNKVVNQPKASVKPVSPKKKIVFPAAIGFGFLLSIGLISLKEFFNSKVLFRSDIEDLTNVPVVGEIAYSKSKNLITVNNPKKAALAEQFRQLRVSVGLLDRNKDRRKILVTSGVAEEGKSFISANLAASLALSGKKVALIDFDLRNRKISNTFKFMDLKGVSDFLVDDAEYFDIIRKTHINNLYIISAGSYTENSTDTLQSEKLEELFSYLNTSFDYIVADTPPIDYVTDAYILAEFFNTTLFAIRHAHTPKTIVELMNENERLKSFNNLSIVFNSIKSRGFMSKGYGIGYGFGYENVYKNRIYDASPTPKAYLPKSRSESLADADRSNTTI